MARKKGGAYWVMNTQIVHLHRAKDAEDAWSINLVGDKSDVWRAERGFGNDFERVWSLELQSPKEPDLHSVDWDAVLERAINAYDLRDPIMTDFIWPIKATV